MAGFYRNRDVEICPIGSLAFYLFYRFMIANELFPVTADPKMW